MPDAAFFSSESVTEGHPDKLCDQISDTILDRALREDPHSRVAIETMAANNTIHIAGQISTKADLNMVALAKQVILEVGYNQSEYGLDGNTCDIIISTREQSPDIALGVNRSYENRETTEAEQSTLSSIGAGDQGLMFGFACNETPELMPLSIVLAHRVCEQLARVRKDQKVQYLRPDGKSQITVQYNGHRPVRVDKVVLSAQHDERAELHQIERDMKDFVLYPVLGDLVDSQTEFYINPTGRFVVGGPQSDAGLTGRKIVVDTYGGYSRHGGGAFSGKDPSKVDRSAAYAARYVAKNIVSAGLAERCEVQLAYAIGVAEPVSVFIETFGTGKVNDSKIIDAINKIFDLRPGKIIELFGLLRPIYRPLATYGHFGRPELDLPWESTDKAEELRKLVNL